MNIQDALKEVKRKLNDPMFYDYSSLAGQLRGFPEIMEDANLDTLAYLLDHGEYGCSKGDIEGLVEFIENKIKKSSDKQGEQK